MDSGYDMMVKNYTGEAEMEAKFFEELRLDELYEILRVRSAVFVVEQECIYLDMDGRDRESVHVFCRKDGAIAAYLRAFVTDRERGVARIGRVLTVQRGVGLGADVLAAGIACCRDKLGARTIELEAQCYAVGFYEKAGFRVCSDPFLDDGIPHVQMILEL